MPRRLLAPFLVLMLALAGCSRPAEDDAPSPTATSASAERAPPRPAFELFTPARLAERPLPASVEPRWVRPDERMNATAPGEPTADWFVASRNPIRTDLPPPLEARAQPGSSVTLALPAAGRHLFRVGDAAFAASIVPGAPRATILVVATGGPDGWTVSPQAARGGPGSRVVVDDRGSADLLVQRADVETYLATGERVSFTMPQALEMGDYDVVATAVDEERVALHAMRVIYDRRKPDAAWEAGPFSGSFRAAANAEPARHDWEAKHDARNVSVSFSLSSSFPAPASARVDLVDAGGVSVAGGTAPGFEVARVPKGAYAFVVTAEEGLLLEYELAAAGEWILVPPATFFST